MKRTKLKRKTPLARSGRLAPRSARPGPACRHLLDRAWRQAVYDRDGHRCAMAGMAGHTCHGGLDCHHIKGRQSHPELRHVVANGVTLCRHGGHAMAHQYPKDFAEWMRRERPGQYAAIEEGRTV